MLVSFLLRYICFCILCYVYTCIYLKLRYMFHVLCHIYTHLYYIKIDDILRLFEINPYIFGIKNKMYKWTPYILGLFLNIAKWAKIICSIAFYRQWNFSIFVNSLIFFIFIIISLYTIYYSSRDFYVRVLKKRTI